jgi:UDP-N-acetylmuramoyl-L-alanyl-D-glutamate--2,6-diaminopimelate ligase
MKIIGVTGTNGKTTFTYVLKAILEQAGHAVFVSGTLSNRLTTPSPWDLQELISRARKQKYDYFVMEVSSHGIHQDRVKGIFFYGKVLTNITRDHLDYHKTMRAYRQVKMGWLKKPGAITIAPRDWKKQNLRDFAVPLLGHFNYENIQAAVAMARALHIPEMTIKKAVAQLQPVPGRFEHILAPKAKSTRFKKFWVLVDYAHTPDGLKNVLNTCRLMLKKQKTAGRLITVFGCGGDRDRTKRPLMGRAVKKLSHYGILTNDNPRFEDPQQIFDDTLKGIGHWQNFEIIPDRRAAVFKALDLAQAGDIVMIAGKGHEAYQIVKNQRLHYSDKATVLKYFKTHA